MKRLFSIRTVALVALFLSLSLAGFSQTSQPFSTSPNGEVLDARVSMLMHQSLQKSINGGQRSSRLLDAAVLSRDQHERLLVHVFIGTTDRGSSLQTIEGLQVTGSYGDIIGARVPVEQLGELALLPSVHRVEAMNRLRPANDNANEDTGVAQLHSVQNDNFPDGHK